MVTPELVSFIKGEVAKGKNKDQIKSELLAGGGWAVTDIEEGFASIDNPTSHLTPITKGDGTDYEKLHKRLKKIFVFDLILVLISLLLPFFPLILFFIGAKSDSTLIVLLSALSLFFIGPISFLVFIYNIFIFLKSLKRKKIQLDLSNSFSVKSLNTNKKLIYLSSIFIALYIGYFIIKPLISGSAFFVLSFVLLLKPFIYIFNLISEFIP